MDTRRRGQRSFRLPIAWKFFLLLALVVPSVLAVAWVGGRGMATIKAEVDSVYGDNLASSRLVGRIALGVSQAEEMSLRMIAEDDPGAIAAIRSALREEVVPQMERNVNELQSTAREAASGDLGLDQRLEARWREFVAYTDSPDFLRATSGPSPNDKAVSSTVQRLAASLGGLVGQIDARELRQAEEARRAADSKYAHSLFLLRVIVGLGLLVGVGSTLWLIRAVVRRVRQYSGFATQVAAGALHTRTRPRGHDELTDLGWALNEMVARGESARSYEETQAEFTDAMQVTRGEEEAHGLLKRHLERSIPRSAAVVLNRNNSADRLEATTHLLPDSRLTGTLANAQPRDCLAVRLGRPHHEGLGEEPLIPCGVCHGGDCPTTCTPLLVGGEVIGSVLLDHGEELNDEQRLRIRDSVAQAAPVLANLRNLAIAELRAATDALSGLPNTRAVMDTMNRLVAQAARMMWPLSVVLLDLDHFKEINDTFGHAKGDEVLAAVGVALQSAVRESDFAGRYGGEEFVLLLPATPREGAVDVAERVRAAIADVSVTEGDRRVTASLGIAVYPDDATDVSRLIRNADRALYRAKANGRNRVEVFSMDQALAGGAASG